MIDQRRGLARSVIREIRTRANDFKAAIEIILPCLVVSKLLPTSAYDVRIFFRTRDAWHVTARDTPFVTVGVRDPSGLAIDPHFLQRTNGTR